jgi:hypothetical protein
MLDDLGTVTPAVSETGELVGHSSYHGQGFGYAFVRAGGGVRDLNR